MALTDHIGIDFRGPKAGGGVGGEVGVARACGEDHHPSLLEVADGPAADVGLGDLVHGDGAEDPGGDSGLLQGVLQGEGIDHRGQHAHVVGAVARSMPMAVAASPRKMLPPPTTTPNSTLRSKGPLISRAMTCRVSGHRPNFFSPARVSPLTLSRTRWYWGSPWLTLASGSHLVAHETGHGDLAAAFGPGFVQKLHYRDVRVLHKDLADEADFLEELEAPITIFSMMLAGLPESAAWAS